MRVFDALQRGILRLRRPGWPEGQVMLIEEGTTPHEFNGFVKIVNENEPPSERGLVVAVMPVFEPDDWEEAPPPKEE